MLNSLALQENPIQLLTRDYIQINQSSQHTLTDVYKLVNPPKTFYCCVQYWEITFGAHPNK